MKFIFLYQWCTPVHLHMTINKFRKKTTLHYYRQSLLRGLDLAWIAGTRGSRLCITDLALPAEHRVAVVVPARRLPLHTLHRRRVRLRPARHGELYNREDILRHFHGQKKPEASLIVPDFTIYV